jgi:hypothetical protein
VTLQEFQTYIENNQQWIPNYGELWRAGETISTAFVESAVNQVLSKRFVKKQQMSWSRRGAHLLLQVRTRALNEEFREKFDEWYPGFNAQSEGQARAAVGSSAGAALRRSPFPAPATSNGAGGFPALRFPQSFFVRVMWLIGLAPLSGGSSEPGSRCTTPVPRTAIPYSTASSRSPSAYALAQAFGFVGLRLTIYSPSQVLQTDGRFYHFTPASRC